MLVIELILKYNEVLRQTWQGEQLLLLLTLKLNDLQLKQLLENLFKTIVFYFELKIK